MELFGKDWLKSTIKTVGIAYAVGIGFFILYIAFFM